MIAHCISTSSPSSHFHTHVPCVISWCVSLIDSTSPFTSSSSSPSLWSSWCSSFCPTTSTSTMWWTNTLHTSAEGLGTLAENEPPTTLRSFLFLCEGKVPYAHLTKLLSKLRPMPCSARPQDHTLLFPLAYLALVPCAALVLTWLVSTLSASRPAIELPHVRTLTGEDPGSTGVWLRSCLCNLHQMGKGISCSFHGS